MPKVVIADDEEMVREFLKTIIDSMGYTLVGEASNGNKLIEVIEDTKPDLLLLDINMPNMTGIEFLQNNTKYTKGLCIIMLTSSANLENVNQCLDYGANHFIRKDTPVERIIETISETWEKFIKEFLY